MISRPFWLARIEQAWREAPIAWLCGVRRCGKTTLAESFGPERAVYVNCDLPAVEDMVRDPQLFFRGGSKPVVIFDEIHQLRDPARILKVGADGFPRLKILAAGSSTLAASRKFRDTLTGRKRVVHFTPVTWDELAAFGVELARRLFHGGLPPALLADNQKPAFYREWLDSFFARDIQRLFGFRDINRFNALFEYVLRQSGGQFEITKAATALGITRPAWSAIIWRSLKLRSVRCSPWRGSGPVERRSGAGPLGAAGRCSLGDRKACRGIGRWLLWGRPQRRRTARRAKEMYRVEDRGDFRAAMAGRGP